MTHFTQDTITCSSVSESDERFSEEVSRLIDSVLWLQRLIKNHSANGSTDSLKRKETSDSFMNWRAHAKWSFSPLVTYKITTFQKYSMIPLNIPFHSKIIVYISNQFRISHGRDCGTFICIFKHKTEKLLLYLYFYTVTAIPKPPICSKSSICQPRENYFWQWFHDIRLRQKSKNK